MNRKKFIVLLISVLSISGCSTNNVEKNSDEPVVDSKSKGAYYLDDGPDEIIQIIYQAY